MKRKLSLAAVVFFLAHAGSFDVEAQLDGTRRLHAFLAKSKEDKPARTFTTDVSDIWLVWKGEKLQAGDKINAIWIAEDVGTAAPKETKIGERSVTVFKPDENGAFSLSRPRGRIWPVGKYRTEIYIGELLVEAIRFSIEKGVSVEVR